MAVEHSSIGLKSIKIAEVDPAAIPTTFNLELEDAQVGSATVTETEATKENIRTEQRKGIYRRITTQEGEVTYTVQLFDLSVDQINAVKGGTVTPATATVGKRWGRTETVDIIKALQLVTFDDFKIYFPKADVSALITWPTTKTALGTITLTFTALEHPAGDIVIEEPLS
ncbi:hypothetical protein [Sphingobacterium thalpophilum]|uniref:hypothetical protein n=1 Tax=Sphingobacterium thalpophilum TaxID=259 RepID=UPI0024A7983F|nr:hypothetical protein [Sphingobacterium thalpophilum]